MEKIEQPWRERKKDKIRARILREARRLFVSKGYEASSIEDVAERAEISKSTFYNYFPNKEALLYNCRDKLIDEILDEIEKNAAKPAWDKIVVGFSAWTAQSFERLPLTRRIVLADAERIDDPSEQFIEIHKIFIDLVDEAKKRNGMRTDIDSEEIVDLLFGVFFTTIFLLPPALSLTQWNERMRTAFSVLRPGLFS